SARAGLLARGTGRRIWGGGDLTSLRPRPVVQSPTAMSAIRLFFYGTLKRGGKNHRLLAGQRFVSPAATAPRYRLFDLGPYPGLVEAAGGVSVRGELWDVTAEYLAPLDKF